MANVLNPILHKLLVRGLPTLRKQTRFPLFVNNSFSTEAKKKGSQIEIPVPKDGIIEDITPGIDPPANADSDFDLEIITLDQWKGNRPFFLTDEQESQIDVDEHFLPMQLENAMTKLAENVNGFLAGLYKKIPTYIGTPGTAPGGSGGILAGKKAATLPRRQLNIQKAPKQDRTMMMDFVMEAEVLELDAFSDFDKTGMQNAVIEGELGRRYGFNWVADDDVVEHVAGTATSTLVNTAVLAAGDTVIAVDTGTGTFKDGDIVTFGSITQTYAVVGDVASVATAITITPALKTGHIPADNATVTILASHTANLAFNKFCFGHAVRAMKPPRGNRANNIAQIRDPLTGLVLRLEFLEQYKQSAWQLDILHGGTAVRHELGIRVVG